MLYFAKWTICHNGLLNSHILFNHYGQKRKRGKKEKLSTKFTEGEGKKNREADGERAKTVKIC